MRKTLISLLLLGILCPNAAAQIKVHSDNKISMFYPTAVNHVQIGRDDGPSTLGLSTGAEFRIARYSTSTEWAFVQGRDNSGVEDIGLQFRTQDAGVLVNTMKINPDGTVIMPTGFVIRSDMRRKADVRPLTLSERTGLLDLQVVSYLPLPHDTISLVPVTERRMFGLDAEQLQAIYPHLVHEDSESFLGVNYPVLIPVLIAVLKDQRDQILSLEEKVAVMEAWLAEDDEDDDDNDDDDDD